MFLKIILIIIIIKMVTTLLIILMIIIVTIIIAIMILKKLRIMNLMYDEIHREILVDYLIIWMSMLLMIVFMLYITVTELKVFIFPRRMKKLLLVLKLFPGVMLWTRKLTP